MNPYYRDESAGITLYHGDALEVMACLPAASTDAVITDPPYPCIDRPYGYWTEAEWFAMMNPVVEECRRILRPSGSAVFVLQPSYDGCGRTRTWLWKFLLEWGERWNQVQDVWWCNPAVLPSGIAIQGRLTRPAVKACVWLGPRDCYRDQDAVLLPLGDWVNRSGPCYQSRKGKTRMPSGQGVARGRVADAAIRRGGSTPLNYLTVTRGAVENVKVGKHPAAIPVRLCRWWVRYICPPGGTVLDPFVGSGTVALAARHEGRRAVGIERDPGYIDIARARIAGPPEAEEPTGSFLFQGALNFGE